MQRKKYVSFCDELMITMTEKLSVEKMDYNTVALEKLFFPERNYDEGHLFDTEE